jgi:hypothetical protein
MRQAFFILFLLIFCTSFLLSQETVTIKGTITGESGEPLTGATVIDLSTGKGTIADYNGAFQLKTEGNKKTLLVFSLVGYKKDTLEIIPKSDLLKTLNIRLEPLPREVNEVVVRSRYDRAEALEQINLRSIDKIPLPSGNVESLLTTLGASTRNEMSSQYSVRGGNFDENLIYVNGIEIYKPMLVKAGQQEGLSFVNSSMVSSIQFAAGGFDARYGDKMSSVLDIKYKRPSAFAASASAGLLGASAHVEGTAFKKRITHITGVRYKTNQYLLNSMQTEGDFKPRFFDIQTFLTFDPSKKIEISFLGNLSVNTYQVIPQSRETAFGTYQQPLNFTVYYEGQEIDRFATWLGALTMDYRPTELLSLRLTGSGFNTSEKITYDILGQYRIDLLDNTPGSETAGDSILNLGYGGNLSHARNYLDAYVNNLNHTGSFQADFGNLSWGIGMQREEFSDRIREWEMIDSAGYSLPYSDENLKMNRFLKSKNNLTSYRLTGFVNNITGFFTGSTEILINAGFRMNYTDVNNQFLVSPRLSVHLIPSWENKVSFHVSTGIYHQPPFYKELRDPDGNLHTHVKAQQSFDVVAGTAWDFSLWERPFRFSAEAYYKKLDHLIPYIVDDVEIQYLPQYTAKGYATGIEFKINGEFVKDAESWASLSFLQTYEDRKGDAYGSYPRATNQLVNFGFFFQDYFPNNPSYRVHLNMYYGSRLPYNSTEYENPTRYFHLQSYRRIDIGLSKSVMIDRNGNRRAMNNRIKDLWFGLEVFNLFGFKNQASYQWVKTVRNQEGVPNVFAVPNYLTGRLLNFRVMVKI